jgi:hypothetical protein
MINHTHSTEGDTMNAAERLEIARSIRNLTAMIEGENAPLADEIDAGIRQQIAALRGTLAAAGVNAASGIRAKRCACCDQDELELVGEYTYDAALDYEYFRCAECAAAGREFDPAVLAYDALDAGDAAYHAARDEGRI